MYGKYLVLFAILFTGWFLRKIDFIDDKMDHSMTKLIVYFAYPCLIVHNIGTLKMSEEVIRNFLITFVISLVAFYAYGFICKGYARLRHTPENETGVVEFAMAAPNDGFMGFPVALIFFGNTGMLLMIAHNAAMNFFAFTYGIALLRKYDGRNQKFRFRNIARAALKLLLNPNILALFIGFAISLAPFDIPAAADEYLTYLGGVSTPMAMIFIGSTLSTCSFKETFSSLITIEASLMKLVWIPLITLAVVYFLPISPLIKSIVVIGGAFPTAATVSMLSEQEGLDARISSKILFMSTMVSIITVPLIINLLGIIF